MATQENQPHSMTQAKNPVLQAPVLRARPAPCVKMPVKTRKRSESTKARRMLSFATLSSFQPLIVSKFSNAVLLARQKERMQEPIMWTEALRMDVQALGKLLPMSPENIAACR